MYIAAGQGQTTPGDIILMSTETSWHFWHLLQLSNLFEVWFYTFVYDFIHVYSPGKGADNPLWTKFWCQQENLVISVICCKLKKNLFEVWFYTFFHDFIHVYNPGAGEDSLPGTTFRCQQKCLVTSFICCKFKKTLWGLILYNFFMI